MTLVQKLRFHDYSFEHTTPSGKWRWTTRLDVSQSSPIYSVRDVVTPYGLLRDSIPLPGTLVQAMAESITELQANFTPRILAGPPSSFTFTVDEGRGFAPGQTLSVTNNGVYGSLLSATMTASQPFIKVTPASVGNLAVNETGQATIEVDATTLLASSSPYNETVSIADPTATNTPVSVPVTVVVRPKATISTSVALLTFTVAKPLSGNFPAIASQTFDVSNTGPGGSVLAFDIKKLTGLCNWISSVLPSSGTLNSSQSSTVTVSVAPPSNMVWGTYSETLRVSGYSSNNFTDVEIRLVIT